MISFNHSVQTVCCTILKNCCQETILYSLACLAYSKLMSFFCTSVVGHFNFFSNLFSFFTFQVFKDFFLLTLPKPNATNRHFRVLKKNVLRCRFHKPLPTSSHPKTILCTDGGSVKKKGAFHSSCMLFCVVTAHRRLCKATVFMGKNAFGSLRTAVMFEVWDNQDDPSGWL